MMVTSFPAAPDLPPGSIPAFRAMQAAIQDLQVDKLSLQSQLSAANAAISRGRQPTTLQQPDLVNANVMIGDAPTLYVDPYAYFTRSGDTQGGLNVSWDYRGPAGELLNGPSEQFEVWVREVRVESDYPAFADMRVDPPPTGDSYMALSTQSMYGVVGRLDIQTTYAVKVRSITSLGVPGNFSDETTVTTPKEPRIRPIDPPYVEQCGTDVCVTWDWTQDWQTPLPGVTGFAVTPTAASGHIIGVNSNGMVYTERYYDPDPADYTAVYEVWITDPWSGLSSIVWTNIPFDPEQTSTGSWGWLERQTHNFVPGPIGGLYYPCGTRAYSLDVDGNDSTMYFAALDGGPSTRKVKGYHLWYYSEGKIFPAPNGLLRTVYTLDSSVLLINTSNWTSTVVTFTGLQFRVQCYLGGTKYFVVGRPDTGGDNIPAIIDIATGTWTAISFGGDDVSGTTSWSSTSDQYNALEYYGGPVFYYNGGYRFEYTGGSNIHVTRLPYGYSGLIETPAREALSFYPSISYYNIDENYGYKVTRVDDNNITCTDSRIVLSMPVGLVDYSWMTGVDSAMRIPGSGGMIAVGGMGSELALLFPVYVAPDALEPFPINPPTPWPEIKYVIAERLTITGWVTVGTYNGPGTIRDSVAPGTYSYRLVPVSNTGVRGVPTAYMTITVV